MSRKRGNGEGSISRRKNGGWMAQYAVHTGEGRKRKTIYGKTRAEVATKLSRALSDREDGLNFDAGRLTVGEYLDRWLNDSVRDSVKQRTFENYAYVVRLHLKPALGGKKLKALVPAEVQRLYRSKLDSGLSARTVQLIHTTLHKALKQAVRWTLVPRNVTEAVTAPRPAKKEIRPLDLEQAQALLKAAAGDSFEALYVLAINRAQEGRAARAALDGRGPGARLPAGTPAAHSHPRWALLHLPQRRQEPEREADEQRLQSPPAPPRAAASGKAQARRPLAGDGPGVFTAATGTTLDADNLVKRSFGPLLENAGLPKIRFHDLRHTFATLLLSGGTHPKVVQEMLGHANISQTMDTYSHVLPDMQDGAVATMQDALY